jgi:hypothetical protein
MSSFLALAQACLRDATFDLVIFEDETGDWILRFATRTDEVRKDEYQKQGTLRICIQNCGDDKVLVLHLERHELPLGHVWTPGKGWLSERPEARRVVNMKTRKQWPGVCHLRACLVRLFSRLLRNHYV